MNVAIILLGFIIMIVVSAVINYRLSIGNEEQKMNVYISNSLRSVDNQLKDMGRVSLICYSDSQSQDILKEFDSYSYSKQLKSVDYLKKQYTSLITLRDDISGVYIFDNNSLVFSQDSAEPAMKKNYDISTFMKKLDSWEKIENQISGCTLILNQLPEFMRYAKSRVKDAYVSNCLYLIREIKSFSPNERIGHILLLIQAKDIKQVLDQYLDSETLYTLLTENGDIICDSNYDYVGKNLKSVQPVLYQNTNAGEGTFRETVDNQECMVSYQVSGYSGITLITRKPMKMIARDSMTFIQIIVVVFLVLVAVIILLTFRCTKGTLKPLRQLSESMANFNQSNMDVRFPVKSQDETGQLISSFNRMMDIINELIHSEYEGKVQLREAELKKQKLSMLYLKNQINPHFLYNTLDTIRIKAHLNGDEDVAYMIMRLVDFFRLSVKADSQMVSIDHEVSLIQAYLKLMCYRYPNLTCEYEIDDTLKYIQIPNFILQPLVENSVLHGIRAMGYRGTIRVSIQKDHEHEENVVIKIFDNGAGMTHETKSLLENRLKKAEDEQEMQQELDNNHIGVLNVQRRLKMFYPDTCGLTYENNPKGGITVTIIVKNENQNS